MAIVPWGYCIDVKLNSPGALEIFNCEDPAKACVDNLMVHDRKAPVEIGKLGLEPAQK